MGIKSYDVMYKAERVVGMKVEARNEEEAKIVADNLLRKDRSFDFKHDTTVKFHIVAESIDQPKKEFNANGEPMIYRWESLYDI